MWAFIVRDLKNIKYRIFYILSIIVKFVLPVGFVVFKSWTTKESTKHLETWGLVACIVIVGIYYFIIRRYLTSGKSEEKIISRLAPEKAKPLKLIVFTFLDDVLISPIIPLILWFICDLLQDFNVNIALAFLVMAIMFIIGGILKLVDLLINLERLYKE